MVFPKVKRANLSGHYGIFISKYTHQEERKSRAVWARALAKEIKELTSDPAQFVGALEKLHNELLAQAELDDGEARK